MWRSKSFSVLLGCFVLASFSTCKKNETTPSLIVTSIAVGNVFLNLNFNSNFSAPIDQPIIVSFSIPIDTSTVTKSVKLMHGGTEVSVKISFPTSTSCSITAAPALKYNQNYQLSFFSSLKGKNGESLVPITATFNTLGVMLTIVSMKVGGIDATNQSLTTDVPLNASVELTFSSAISPSTIAAGLSWKSQVPISFTTTLSNESKTITLTPAAQLVDLTKFTLTATPSLEGQQGESFSGYSKIFYTQAGASPKFPVISDSALLDLVQQQTLKYFYDFGHANSGMARERNTSADVVATGGSGFGIMAMVSGINRGFISRADGISRFTKIISFLEKADRFHGAWPHWINGITGKVVPFATNDDGADIVETSYMIQGLLTLRQYLTSADTAGNNMINRISKLYQNVEWDWFRQNNQNVLYWNWSPNYGFAVNVPVRGYNETLITYLLAAGSATHSIPAEVYQQGWAQSGSIKNGKTFFGHMLPLGQDYGGPLFFTQYSFLGFDPHVHDSYLSVDYWMQNVNQSLINHDYCVANPKKYVGYGDNCWGLTASDNPTGYGAQSPTNDNGTISPTAAISSMPYTPAESMKAIKFFYYTIGDKMWGQYGFYDAFNVTNGWTATSTLAIDQGPIVVMIENYRTQLLWKLFTSAPEVQAAKTKLGFN